MSSIEKAMQRQAEKKKFGQKTNDDASLELEKTDDETSDRVGTQTAIVEDATVKDTAGDKSAVENETTANLAETPEPIVTEDINQAETQPKDETAVESGISTEQVSEPEAKEEIQTGLTDQFGSVEETSTESTKSSEDIASDLKPVSKDLHINTSELEEKGFVALSKKRTLINEEFRSIKRKVLTNAFGPLSKTLNHSNLILVSSSRPNEGKTFTAVNLALSIALEQDKTVLLVDADVLKPSVSKTLNIGANVGLIEYLAGEVENVGDVIYHTNIENLKVLPAGLPHHLSNELLSSDKMQQLFEEFASRYPDRVVVFDCPPLLGVNETALMAAQCGQGVIVVEELRSKVSEVKKATELLPEEMAVGFVLNKVLNTNDADSYGYGYYYSTGD